MLQPVILGPVRKNGAWMAFCLNVMAWSVVWAEREVSPEGLRVRVDAFPNLDFPRVDETTRPKGVRVAETGSIAGLMADLRENRARAIFNRLMEAVPASARPLGFEIVPDAKIPTESGEVPGPSFRPNFEGRGPTIVVPRGFLERYGDHEDVLRQNIGHEIGHRLQNLGAYGLANRRKFEAAADFLGLRLNAETGVKPENMTDALKTYFYGRPDRRKLEDEKYYYPNHPLPQVRLTNSAAYGALIAPNGPLRSPELDDFAQTGAADDGKIIPSRLIPPPVIDNYAFTADALLPSGGGPDRYRRVREAVKKEIDSYVDSSEPRTSYGDDPAPVLKRAEVMRQRMLEILAGDAPIANRVVQSITKAGSYDAR